MELTSRRPLTPASSGAAERLKRFDWLSLGLIVFLCLVGVVFVTRGGGGLHGAFGRRQAVFLGLGLAVLGGLQAVPYRFWARFAGWGYLAALALLVYLAVNPAPTVRGGAVRWIPLGPVNVQPSELMKLALVLFLANDLRFRPDLRRLRSLFWPTLALVVPAGLVLLQPDLGTALIFLPVFLALIFAAGIRWRHLALLMAVGLVLVPVFWFGVLKDYQKTRIFSFINPERDPQGSGYQVLQSVTAIGSGRLRGMGLGRATTYLPDRHTDFIFSLVGQEWGFLGAGAVLAAYLLLILRFLAIAYQSRDPFGRLLVVGITTILAAHVFVNVGMTLRLMPVTGLTLPLVSYGGSSLVTFLAGCGLALNVGWRQEFVFTLRSSEGATRAPETI